MAKFCCITGKNVYETVEKNGLAGAITGLVLASGMSVEAWHVNGFLTGAKGIVENAGGTTIPVEESTVTLEYDYLDDGTIEITDCPTSAAGALEIPAEIDGVAVTSIGDNAFQYCDSLTFVMIPYGVTSIGYCAFSDCDALTTITIPDSVTSIGAWVLAYCDSLTFITIPDGVTSIGECEFSGRNALTSIVVDNKNTAYCSIDGVLFDKNLETLICYPGGKTSTFYAIPDGVTCIRRFAFNACVSLMSIAIPDGVTSIEPCAFSWCSSLTSITIPDNVTNTGGSAFCDCESLTSITIPDSVTSIGWHAFYGCEALTDVYYTGTQSQWEAISIDSRNSCLTNATIHYNATPATTSTTTTTNNNPILPTGDLDGDGSITIQDAYNALVAYSKASAGLDAGLTDAQREATDVDGDGKITIGDAYKILLYYANTVAGTGVTWEEILG
ncbi:MAG: leucine-rich repeat protein [Ruminococcus sp.]|nr:leucine-rich repeat protein [Ruminococcus sp.]